MTRAPLAVARLGPRAVEAALLADLREALPDSLDAVREDPRPVRVVVPSRSLRRHLLATIARRFGAVAGLEVATLRRTAEEILNLGGNHPAQGEDLADLFLKRAAEREKGLIRELGDLRDGIDTTVASLRDLIDAGLEPELAPGLDELLAAEAPRDAATGRARGLVRAASRAIEDLRAHGLASTADLYRAARSLLLANGPSALPARGVFIHGFTDATGVATDLIAALLARTPARIYLDLAGLEGEPGAGGRDRSFGRNFRERVIGVAPFDGPTALREGGRPDIDSPGVVRLEASNRRFEVQEVAHRILEAMADGVEPERIGVVARELGPYATTLRSQLTRLAVPFSGESTVPIGDPSGRRLSALLDLVELRGGAPIERWLSVREPSGVTPFELRTAFFLLGASRLERAASLDPEHDLPPGDLSLPIREGLGEADGDEGPALPRRRVSRTRLVGAIREAAALLEGLASWPEEALLTAHHRVLGRLLRRMRVEPESELARAIESARGSLQRSVPLDLTLRREELVRLLRRAAEGAQASPLGGSGAGVQVLDVTAARGRTFERLFVLGLNATSFPRVILEDAVLPDRLRLLLAPLLPDLPRKLEGRDEERVLFAQLLLAAPSVVLCRPRSDDEGRPYTVSPLFLGLATAVESARADFAFASEEALGWAGARLLTPEDAAIAAALHLPRGTLQQPLAAALVESDVPLGTTRRRLAEAHLAVLAEVDPEESASFPSRRFEQLGPYFGFVGPQELEADPRRRQLAITSLEAICTCPWRYFLEKLLRLELPPDQAEELPALEPLRLGRILHAVLEEIGSTAHLRTEGSPPGLDAVASRHAVPVEWPVEDELRAAARRAAELELAAEGLGRWSLARAEAERAMPYLSAARAADGGRFFLLGSEAEGELSITDEEGTTALSFRADRVERMARTGGSEGPLLLTDFKTGRPGKRLKSEAGRHREVLRQIATGRRLQAAVYAVSAAQLPPRAGEESPVGRYVYLAPDLEARERTAEVSADDPEAAAYLSTAVAAGTRALRRGSFFPRLLDSKLEKSADPCSRCQVVAACLQHDSAARLRLAAFLSRSRTGDLRPPSPEERSLVALFDLGLEADREES